MHSQRQNLQEAVNQSEEKILDIQNGSVSVISRANINFTLNQQKKIQKEQDQIRVRHIKPMRTTRNPLSPNPMDGSKLISSHLASPNLKTERRMKSNSDESYNSNFNSSISQRRDSKRKAAHVPLSQIIMQKLQEKSEQQRLQQSDIAS